MQTTQISTYLDHAEESEGLLVQLDQAIGAHRKWQDEFKKMIAAGEPLEVSTLSKEDCCELGKWLHSDGRKLYGGKPEFVKLLARHDDFHHSADRVAHFMNDREYSQAEKMLGTGSQFAQASMDVEVAIMRLQLSLSN
jgi:hypothetical protein